MSEIPTPWYSDEKPTTGKTFFGISLKEFRCLSHREQMQAIAKHDKRHGMKATYHADPVYGTTWKVLKPTKKPRKK